jgi:hypothetical protein
MNSFDAWAQQGQPEEPTEEDLARGARRFMGGCLMIIVGCVGVGSVVVKLATWDWQLVVLVGVALVIGTSGGGDR